MAARKKESTVWKKNTNHNRGGNTLVNSPTPAELKFKEAHGKLQAAVQKYVQDYESSSSEDELESDNIIGEIIKNYTKTGAKDEYLGRTKTFLQDSFLSGTVTCLICISRIKRDSSIWNCNECYCVFHLTCIQRWSKDSIFQQKQIQEGPIQVQKVTLTWGCPKCRHNYQLEDIPDKYYCFCGKTTNPELQPFLVPHSCGDICGKDLVPLCGHRCLLLCHPGPCPPCPVTVSVTCYCGKKQPATRRCSDKKWSCGGPCGKLLTCQKHSCSEVCHPGDCKPCPKKSLQKCLCKTSQKLRDCATPIWQCDRVCNKPLQCGNHSCSIVCHEGICDSCPLTKQRTCPCGKSKYQLPCTEETPTCQDTCDKLLTCGLHRCNQRCHKDACGACLEIVEKSCKCGLHSKEVHCSKPYFCETKCKRMRDCNKHPCNKKCCDGSCPPCEKPCGRTLNCGNHKCNSVCHRGLCYPCNQTDVVTCRCGQTKLTVPCGRKHKTRPPKCSKLCLIPPDCHHEKREPHKCHFGDCPPCKQICNKPRSKCPHLCSASCHSAVVVKIESKKASMPWEQTKPQLERKALACPDCEVPVSVTCLGEHETCDWPCYKAVPSSCHRPCGRQLTCENHTCTLPCHVVDNSPNKISAGQNCEICENPCSKPRPEGCQHDCPKPCHPGPCPPCKQMLRIRCHCGLNQPYVSCNDWLSPEKREEIQSCGNQCPKNFDCGHRCRANCHSGPCPNPELCRRKVKLTCKCKRLKKEFSCETVRNNAAKVECDEICNRKKEEDRKQQELINEQKRKEEELKNERELAKYKKIFESKKRTRDRRAYEEEEEVTFIKKYWFLITTFTAVVLSAVVFFILK
ncbi:NF-X1-type zinc finger protein NFXL1 [Tribolium castaneum]|uniref:NF-X1-type zinc finger protein NFXL1 n=1 Tax=Tribolium castaneum TaxID=7070 RepID=UPI0030FE779B